MQSEYAWPTLTLVALAALSIAVERWRHSRRIVDPLSTRAGWVPWPLITILALIAGAYCGALWLGDG